jgi:hypothetical protein
MKHLLRATVLCVVAMSNTALANPITAAAYDTLQAAIDANPGKMVFLPDGDHLISEKLRINKDNSGLYGYGRVVQTNPAQPVLEIEHASGIRIHDVTFTRAEGQESAIESGLVLRDVRNVQLRGVRVIDCRSRSAAIDLYDGEDCIIENSEILNYKCITIDDRTDDPEHWGYAFHALDGTGIVVKKASGTIIRDNRIVEKNLMPTRALKAQYQLGVLTEGKHAGARGKFSEAAYRNNYVNSRPSSRRDTGAE